MFGIRERELSGHIAGCLNTLSTLNAKLDVLLSRTSKKLVDRCYDSNAEDAIRRMGEELEKMEKEVRAFAPEVGPWQQVIDHLFNLRNYLNELKSMR